jgi:shikimate kinase
VTSFSPREHGINRPLLDGLNSEQQLQKISTLLTERKASYETGQITVRTDELDTIQVCFEIISKLGALS